MNKYDIDCPNTQGNNLTLEMSFLIPSKFSSKLKSYEVCSSTRNRLENTRLELNLV